jgi:hypothetical protein
MVTVTLKLRSVQEVNLGYISFGKKKNVIIRLIASRISSQPLTLFSAGSCTNTPDPSPSEGPFTLDLKAKELSSGTK